MLRKTLLGARPRTEIAWRGRRWKVSIYFLSTWHLGKIQTVSLFTCFWSLKFSANFVKWHSKQHAYHKSEDIIFCIGTVSSSLSWLLKSLSFSPYVIALSTWYTTYLLLRLLSETFDSNCLRFRFCSMRALMFFDLSRFQLTMEEIIKKQSCKCVACCHNFEKSHMLL